MFVFERCYYKNIQNIFTWDFLVFRRKFCQKKWTSNIINAPEKSTYIYYEILNLLLIRSRDVKGTGHVPFIFSICVPVPSRKIPSLLHPRSNMRFPCNRSGHPLVWANCILVMLLAIPITIPNLSATTEKYFLDSSQKVRTEIRKDVVFFIHRFLVARPANKSVKTYTFFKEIAKKWLWSSVQFLARPFIRGGCTTSSINFIGPFLYAGSKGVRNFLIYGSRLYLEAWKYIFFQNVQLSENYIFFAQLLWCKKTASNRISGSGRKLGLTLTPSAGSSTNIKN